ncbi:hypothetical protein Cthiooxydans_15600 [Comamonas thiooxydans]|nr:hypothetical protein Cthiooxydans_15600 [Comamonas thiooxydans]
MPFSLRNAALNMGFVLLRARCIARAAFMPIDIAEPACGGNVVFSVPAAVLPGMQMLCRALVQRKLLAGEAVLAGKR